MYYLKKLLTSSAVFVLILSLYTGITYAEGSREGIVSGNRVNIRETASTDAKVLSTLEKGTKVSVISSSGEWTKIKHNKVTGWVYSSLLSSSKVSRAASVSTGTVTAGTLNVRSKASSSSAIVTKLKEGDTVSILEHSGEWYRIKTSTGKTGWVVSNYVSTKKVSKSRETKTSRGGEVSRTAMATMQAEVSDEEDTQKDTSTGSEIIGYAKKFLGIRYVYGGDSPKEGFDCSGFVKYVFAHYGISMERTAADQAAQGKKVSRSNLRVGDLVFFDTNGGHNHINHVGIYIGDGKFIHASSPRYDVTITELSESYYARSYMTARRIIN